MRVFTATLLVAALWAVGPADAGALAKSDEEFIRSLFVDYLNRKPARGEIPYWKGIMDARGASRQNMRLTFLSTEEFFNLHRRDRSAMLRAWYRHLLRRQPTRGELATWLDRWAEYHEGDRSSLATDFWENAVVPERRDER